MSDSGAGRIGRYPIHPKCDKSHLQPTLNICPTCATLHRNDRFAEQQSGVSDMACQARRENDQMRCAPCGLIWDVDDTSRPECAGKAASVSQTSGKSVVRISVRVSLHFDDETTKYIEDALSFAELPVSFSSRQSFLSAAVWRAWTALQKSIGGDY